MEIKEGEEVYYHYNGTRKLSRIRGTIGKSQNKNYEMENEDIVPEANIFETGTNLSNQVRQDWEKRREKDFEG